MERVAEALRLNGEAHYNDALMRQALPAIPLPAIPSPAPAALEPEPALPQGKAAADDSDDLFDRAVAIVHRDQKASTSYLQRRLSIGFNRAADLIERMEREGLITTADAVGRRRVIMGAESDEGSGDSGSGRGQDDREDTAHAGAAHAPRNRRNTAA